MLNRAEIKLSAKEGMRQQRGTAIGTPLLAGLVAGFLSIFGLPLYVNSYGVFHSIYKREKTSVGEVFSKFGENYLRKLGGTAGVSFHLVMVITVCYTGYYQVHILLHDGIHLGGIPKCYRVRRN